MLRNINRSSFSIVCPVFLAIVAATVDLARGVTPPEVGQGPCSQTIEEGATVVFSVDAVDDSQNPNVDGNTDIGAAASQDSDHGGEATKYQWLRGGTPLVGASESVLIIKNASSADAGSYRCSLSNSAGSVLSDVATLHVVKASIPGRLIRISCRTFSGLGEDRLTAGFVIGSTSMLGQAPVSMRASGPGLLDQGVERALPYPALVLRDTSGVIALCRGWAGERKLAAGNTGTVEKPDALGRDSALNRALPCGAYTAEIFGDKGDTGFADAQILDASLPSQWVPGAAHLVNASIRSPVGLGPNVPVMRFSIGGSTSITLLIRGMGPALRSLGISRVLETPSLLLYRINGDSSQTWLQSNTRWGGKHYLSDIARKVGAFPWKSDLTADATILLTLPPADYLLILAGANGETGVALMELYEIP